MVGRIQGGELKALYEVLHNGVRFCSICGVRMETGSHYTKQVIYDPVYRRKAWMALCAVCCPFEVVPWNDIEVRDTPVRVSTPPSPPQNTTGSMQPVARDGDSPNFHGASSSDSGWLNSVPPPPPQKSGSTWKREAPTHIDQVMTQILPAAQRSVRTDPKLWAILKEVVLHGKR